MLKSKLKMILLLTLLLTFFGCDATEEYEVDGLDGMRLETSSKKYTIKAQSTGGHEIKSSSCELEVAGTKFAATKGTLDTWQIEQEFYISCRNDNNTIKCDKNAAGVGIPVNRTENSTNITSIITRCVINNKTVMENGEMKWTTVL